MDSDLASLRREYADEGLAESDLADDPVAMFHRWFDEAVAADLYEPNAMVLATVSADGRPSSRMVLLKGVDEHGFVFFTNLASRKGQELNANLNCSLLFPWHPLERQIRIDGVATPLPRADVEAYFAVRPRGSRLGAHASHQSQPVSGREELMAAYDAVATRYGDGDVPAPLEWGGFRVVADAIEFWQGRPGRMHDRHVYHRATDGWTTQRLAP